MSEDDPAWFYASGDQRKGPVTRAHMRGLLAIAAVRPETLVWTAGMPGWLPLEQTVLRELLAGQPVPPELPHVAGGAVPAGNAAPPRSFTEAIRACFARYVQFQGRASRSEFWYFYLFGVIVSFTTAAVDAMLWRGGGSRGFVQGIAFLILFLPSLSVGIRRLHDTDRTGWWWWLNVIPLIGQIVLFVFWCERPTQGRNRFG